MNLTTATSQPARLLATLHPSCVRAVNTVQSSHPSGKSRHYMAEGESDFGALVYIVVVLVFYSAGTLLIFFKNCILLL